MNANNLTQEDKTAVLVASTDYCRAAIQDVPGLSDSVMDEEISAMDRIRTEALGGWFERRDLDLSDDDMEKAQKAVFTYREHLLDEEDFEQAVEAEFTLRALLPDDDTDDDGNLVVGR